MPDLTCISCSAGRATSGKIPISMPSNIQPKNAAVRAIHWPVFVAAEASKLVGSATRSSAARGLIRGNLSSKSISFRESEQLIGPAQAVTAIGRVESLVEFRQKHT